MKRTVLLNVVGLTSRLVGEWTPRLAAYRRRVREVLIDPVLPAVTCVAQSTYLTGLAPSGHGIVGNGWYDRDLAEVQFWKQSNRLVRGEKLWETLGRRQAGFTCAKLFWWYNMHSTATVSITPRPLYLADGRKVFDIHSWPHEVRPRIKADLGEFPFPGFWGPAAGRDTPQGSADAASRWIAASARWTEEQYRPDLSLVYLPHLDYNLQRYGVTERGVAGGKLLPVIRRDLEEIDRLVGELLDYYDSREVRVVVISEYGLVNVDLPVHLNRIFREQGWLVVKDELGTETLDAGSSRVLAVADHQVAHLYVADPALRPAVKELVAGLAGVEAVLDGEQRAAAGLDHGRSGDLVALARSHAWFTYYYWLDDARAPDFARCVDIHRKPGYDPVELFTRPEWSEAGLKARLAWRLLKKKLGFRMLMDVIPLDASLVRGSHGVRPADRADWPILWLPGDGPTPDSVPGTGVRDLLLAWWPGTG